MWRIVNVVGTRPNFMKVAPLWQEYRRHPDRIAPVLVHTGQHYDDNMSARFFAQLELPTPDAYLHIGSGSHAQQTARILLALERYLTEQRPDLVVVFGDGNSTMAAALTAAQLHIPVAHVEAGLRSFDRTMPEEINRILTDALSDYLFTSCADATANLRREGVPVEKIHFVGNVMIDSLRRLQAASPAGPPGLYGVVTLHRPGNVDAQPVLAEILSALQVIQKELPLIFPVHPRTAGRLREFGFWNELQQWPGLKLVEPLGYLDAIGLLSRATVVLTDSGGVQEETTALGVPCLTIRENTERPVTVTEGTNTLVGTGHAQIVAECRKVLAGHGKRGRLPQLWDGHAAERIVQCLLDHPPKK